MPTHGLAYDLGTKDRIPFYKTMEDLYSELQAVFWCSRARAVATMHHNQFNSHVHLTGDR